MQKRRYSIKHVLNRNLKPIVDPIDPSIKLYPVYVQLIYKRKNYLFKSIVTTYYTDLNYSNKNDVDIMSFECDFLRNIIELEIAEKKEKFDVPGFAFQYEKYRRSIVSEAEKLLIGKIEHLIRSGESKFQNVIDFKYEPGKLHLLLEAAKVLVPDIRENTTFKICELSEIFWESYNNSFPMKEKYGLIFPTLYDWIRKGHKTVMRDFIESTFKGVKARLLMEYLEEFDFGMRAQTVGV
ncbi:MAG TPA: hypothetical protein VMV47_07010 [Bacteroidales bacterium]|nr:hypothetical protein [Bacteroidales bacterium]